MTRIVRVGMLALLFGAVLLQVGCCCTCATPVRRNPVLDRLRNMSGILGQRSVSRTQASFADLTDTRVLELQVASDVSHVDVQARIQLDKGEMRWRLTDPLGRPRWEGALSQPRTIRDQQRFEAQPGTWVLQIEFRDASGEYEIEWVRR